MFCDAGSSMAHAFSHGIRATSAPIEGSQFVQDRSRVDRLHWWCGRVTWTCHDAAIPEGVGAIGLMVPRALPAAAYGLIALLVAMFPANVQAARKELTIAGRRAMPLLWRLPLQLFWIAALWWIRSPTPN